LTFEVELKFATSDDLYRQVALTERLKQLGAIQGELIQQIDRYYNHPCRDFARTDESLRFRYINRGDSHYAITYKGPIVDTRVKSRREIELPLDPNYEQFKEMIELLGFVRVGEVHKSRLPYELDWEGFKLEVALDMVQDLGDYMEIETLATTQTKDKASGSIIRLAEHLGYEKPERRSYISMLLEKNAKGPRVRRLRDGV